MNKRDRAIVKWVKSHKGENAWKRIGLFFVAVEAGMPNAKSVHGMIKMAFEAGRQFQNDNPNLELNNPSVYLD